MSEQPDPLSNEPVTAIESSGTEPPTNRLALAGMVLGVLPTIGIVILVAVLYVMMEIPALRTWIPLVAVLGLLLALFILASYSLAFLLGVIGLRQIARSEGREKGKKLAWTAIALSSAYCLLLWVLPMGSVMFKWAPNRDIFVPPAVTLNAPPTIVPILLEDRSSLSGEWIGTETLTAVGSCKFEQGDSVTNPVKMLWSVSEEGEVSITLPDWPGVYPYTFKGEIQPDLSISLELSTSAMCSGNESPYSSTFEGVILVEGNTLALDIEATEVWCPGTCVFTRRFSIQKTSESP